MAAIPRPVLVAASLAAGALLLLALAIYTPWARLLERIATVPWPGWLAATLGMSATYALRAGRLRAEWQWRLSGLGLGFRECLRVTLMHNAAVNLLPMRSGEASYAFLLHRRWGVGLGDAAASLLWLRLQDAMVLGVLGLAILLPLPLAARVALAAGAIAATAKPMRQGSGAGTRIAMPSTPSTSMSCRRSHSRLAVASPRPTPQRRCSRNE